MLTAGKMPQCAKRQARDHGRVEVEGIAAGEDGVAIGRLGRAKFRADDGHPIGPLVNRDGPRSSAEAEGAGVRIRISEPRPGPPGTMMQNSRSVKLTVASKHAARAGRAATRAPRGNELSSLQHGPGARSPPRVTKRTHDGTTSSRMIPSATAGYMPITLGSWPGITCAALSPRLGSSACAAR